MSRRARSRRIAVAHSCRAHITPLNRIAASYCTASAYIHRARRPQYSPRKLQQHQQPHHHHHQIYNYHYTPTVTYRLHHHRRHRPAPSSPFIPTPGTTPTPPDRHHRTSARSPHRSHTHPLYHHHCTGTIPYALSHHSHHTRSSHLAAGSSAASNTRTVTRSVALLQAVRQAAMRTIQLSAATAPAHSAIALILILSGAASIQHIRTQSLLDIHVRKPLHRRNYYTKFMLRRRCHRRPSRYAHTVARTAGNL